MLTATYQAKDAHIVIVGGQSGIGKALIPKLLEANARVFSLDISEPPTEFEDQNFSYHRCRPTDLEEMQAMAEEIGRSSPKLTGLVCLSGTIKHFKPMLEQSPEEWQEVFDISFKSCYNACKVFAPGLQAADKASIVNMSSGLALLGQKNYGPYSNAKAAILSLSKSLAAELAPGIRVNSIAPGAVNTDFLRDKEGKTRVDLEMYQKLIPLGSIARAEEIADLIMFLLSEASSHITGQCIHINGGAMMV